MNGIFKLGIGHISFINQSLTKKKVAKRLGMKQFHNLFIRHVSQFYGNIADTFIHFALHFVNTFHLAGSHVTGING